MARSESGPKSENRGVWLTVKVAKILDFAKFEENGGWLVAFGSAD